MHETQGFWMGGTLPVSPPKLEKNADVGEIFGNTIPPVAEILFVAHDAHRVEVVRRSADGSWSETEARSGASVRLESLGCDLAVDDVYRDPLAPR